jgi:hypothetical protein
MRFVIAWGVAFTLFACGETGPQSSRIGAGSPMTTAVVPNQTIGKIFLAAADQVANGRKGYRSLAVIAKKTDDVFISATIRKGWNSVKILSHELKDAEISYDDLSKIYGLEFSDYIKDRISSDFHFIEIEEELLASGNHQITFYFEGRERPTVFQAQSVGIIL